MSDLDNIFANAKAVKARTSTANESLDSQSSRFTQLLFEELQKIRDEINSKPEMRETIRGEMQIKPLDGNGREASLYGSYPITTVKIIDHRLHISAETYVERSSGAYANAILGMKFKLRHYQNLPESQRSELDADIINWMKDHKEFDESDGRKWNDGEKV